MYNKEQLNYLYNKIADAIDISEELFDKAEEEYKALGKWLDSETPYYDVSIYAQGSFALGTVIKPVDETDNYDLDLVCEFADYYGLNAKQLKVDVVKPLLVSYDKVIKNPIEKRRCWQLDYERSKNFYMDIIPAINVDTHIHITDKNKENASYSYIGSNPKGYIDWFNKQKEVRYKSIKASYIEEQRNKQMVIKSEIEPIK